MRHSISSINDSKRLRQQLLRIFRGFGEYCTNQEMEECESDGILTPHFVMRLFTEYFAGNREAFSKKQFQELGMLIKQAIAENNAVENAISTCFLEHLRQIQCYKALSPYLSMDAKRKHNQS